MKWLGHKRIDETMLYVDVADHHGREMPELVREAGKGDHDPDVRIIRMLGARADLPTEPLAIPAGTPSKSTRRPPTRTFPRTPRQQAANGNAASDSPRVQVSEIADVPLALLCSGGGLRTTAGPHSVERGATDHGHLRLVVSHRTTPSPAAAVVEPLQERDAIADVLEAALERWRREADARELRRALLRLLADLDE
jgi:hypothetical protein